MNRWWLVLLFASCGGVPSEKPDAGARVDAGVQDAGFADAGVTDAGVPDAGVVDAGVADAGVVDAGEVDAGVPDAGEVDAGIFDAGLSDAGAASAWRFVPITGSKCARGAQAGIGYNAGATDELVIYLQGGGACWNNGTCQPSFHQWGPICNYGMNSLCFYDDSGGTQPTAVLVSHPDPFPSDGGGRFPAELASVSSSLLFARRAENPVRDATYVFVPYCTGDLHAGDATRTYFVKADAFAQPAPRTHHFAGATNMDLYLANLRAQHPVVQRVWLFGVSGGGYGASLNFDRVKRAFPEATVHLLADSAPMLQPAHWNAWATEWNIQLPQACADCDGGLPRTMEFGIDSSPNSRVALLAFDRDPVIARFFYSGGTTDSWLNAPFGTYATNLAQVTGMYDSKFNARYFIRREESHVMLQGYGMVQTDGGISAPYVSTDGGATLRAWIDAWVTGSGSWQNQ